MTRHRNSIAILLSLGLVSALANGCADDTVTVGPTVTCEVSSSTTVTADAVAISGDPTVIAGLQIAQSFKPSARFTTSRLELRLSRTGFPTGTVAAVIAADSGSGPSASALAFGTLSVTSDSSAQTSNISTSESWHTFTLNTTVTLEASTLYWIRVSADWARGASHFLKWGASDANPYTRGNALTETSTTNTWTTSILGTNRDFAFRLGCS